MNTSLFKGYDVKEIVGVDFSGKKFIALVKDSQGIYITKVGYVQDDDDSKIEIMDTIQRFNDGIGAEQVYGQMASELKDNKFSEYNYNPSLV